MEKVSKFEQLQPRFLRYRSHYRYYLFFLLFASALLLTFWSYLIWAEGPNLIWREYVYEIVMSGCYFVLVGSFYGLWLRPRINHKVQVFSDHILVHKGHHKEEIFFGQIESVSMVCWSLFYFKMKDGHKHFFSSSLERSDYIWEAFYAARPELLPPQEYETYRLKLVQYDHHQKRKEWFFKHKMVDLVNWVIMPLTFLSVAYVIQSREVFIHQPGLYFFRLFMYAMLIMLISSFFFSILLKKFIFDQKLKGQMQEEGSDKLRDVEFEGVILHRSKIMQMMMGMCVFALVLRADVNLFSVTKLKEDLAGMGLKKGQAVLVDNRYNCLSCKYHLKDGDLIVFGRGHVGQVMAKEGETVAEISQDGKGRIIASTNMQEVPAGHFAIKMPHSKEITFVKIKDIIGRIQK